MIKPVIRLEVATQRETRWLLRITYLTIGFCIAYFFAVDRQDQFDSLHFPLQACTTSPPPPNSRACVFPSTPTSAAVATTATTWQGRVELDPVELFFTISLKCKPSNPLDISNLLNLHLEVDIFGASSSPGKREWTTTSPVYSSGEQSVSLACRTRREVTGRPPHQVATAQCDALDLLRERDWMFRQSDIYSAYVMRVTVHNLDLLASCSTDDEDVDGEVSGSTAPSWFGVHYHNKGYREAQMVLRTIGLVVLLVVSCVWFYKLREAMLLPGTRVVREQYWVSVLMVLVVFIADPLFIPLALHPVKALWVASSVFMSIGVVGLLIFWSMLAHGLAGVGSVTDKPLWFYGPKITLGTVFFILFVVLSSIRSTEKPGEGGTVAVVVFIFISMAVWLYFIAKHLRRARKRLSHLPYVATRFRQVTYRLFITQTIAVFVAYMLIFSTWWTQARHSLYEYPVPYGAFVLGVMYLISLAYCYSPVPLSRLPQAGDSEVAEVVENNTIEAHAVPISAVGADHDGALRVLLPKRFSINMACFLSYLSNHAYSLAAEGDESAPREPELSYRVAIQARREVEQPLLGDPATPAVRFVGYPDVDSVNDDPPSPSNPYALPYIGRSSDAQAAARPVGFQEEAAQQVQLARAQTEPFRPSRPSVADGDRDAIAELGFTLVDTFSSELDLHGFVCRRANVVVVAFKGTDSSKNAFLDAKFAREKLGSEDSKGDLDGFSRTVKVHGGFWEGYCSVRDQMFAIVQRAIQECDRSASPAAIDAAPVQVICTGHSLGGALASLAAFQMAALYQFEVQLYTFGSPRVGDHAFAAEFDKAVPLAFRTCMDRDVVTTLPKFCCMFKHHGQEVLVDVRGNWIQNPLFIETMWPFRERRTQVRAHLMWVYRHSLRRAVALSHALEVQRSEHNGPEFHVQLDVDPRRMRNEALSMAPMCNVLDQRHLPLTPMQDEFVEPVEEHDSEVAQLL